MSSLTTEQLFAYLIVDNIQVEKGILDKAKNGEARSISEIANIYYNKKDYKKAMEWHLLSASKDFAHSQRVIGYMFSQGLGVSKDYKAAMEWYLYAYNKGNVTSTTNIGYLYENGLGVAKDVKTAMKWYLEAANNGEEFAMCNIGTFYELGCGVEKDKQYALEWYEKSAHLGHQRAKDKIKRLNREGYHLNDRQKKYLNLEKDMQEQNEKINSLEKKLGNIKSIENKLRLTEQKLLKAEKEKSLQENEIRLLLQENEILKLNQHLYEKAKVTNLDKIQVDQLEKAVSKVIRDYIDSNGDVSVISQDDPSNDLCYDG